MGSYKQRVQQQARHALGCGGRIDGKDAQGYRPGPLVCTLSLSFILPLLPSRRAYDSLNAFALAGPEHSGSSVDESGSVRVASAPEHLTKGSSKLGIFHHFTKQNPTNYDMLIFR